MVKGFKFYSVNKMRSQFFTHFSPQDTILAVPKIFSGLRLEYFDRGAKDCSLHRPLDALAIFVPRGTQKAEKSRLSATLFCFFQGNVSFGEAAASFYITDGADAERTGAADPSAGFPAARKALLFGMLTE